MSFHSLPPVPGSLPKLYVLSASGIILLATSAFRIIVSVFASPIVISPSAVMLPVACILPVTFMSACTSTVPVPLGRNSRLAFELLVLITLPSISMLSITALF